MHIRMLRLKNGWSQEQLAHMAGVSTRTIQRIERGAKAAPETLKCLASVLEVDFAELQEYADMTAAPAPDKSPEQEALEYVRDIKSFYTHALIFGLVNAGLLILNLFLTPGYFWVGWSILGWGIGLAAHGLSVFEIFDLFGPEWERRQVEKRLRQRQ